MTLQEKPFRLCWTAENARAVFRTEALEGNDAVFLATHSPIVGFDIGGRDQGEIYERTEQAILDTLSDTNRKHAFCVVQGEPGSGKSHLIRWLSVNWPHASDLKLLLRRSDGSLEGALNQLREKLGPEYSDLFQNLGVKQRATTEGRANIFIATLATTLKSGHYASHIGDEVWCDQYRPDLFFQHSLIREKWPAPLRIVKLLEGSGGERNSASASFDLYDIADLDFDTVRRVKLELTDHRAKELARRLEREIEKVLVYRENNWLASELETEKSDEFPTSMRLLDALNCRRNDSIQSVLGISADGLKALFRRVREALQQRGKRLVLLLEDITSWEGLDDSLIDALVFNASASGDEDTEDVCPLISVVGVTPKYYDDLQANYRQRITHEIILGRSAGGTQDVATLRDTEERTAFVARYLSAVRAGPDQLNAWRDDLRHRPNTAPPNPCTTCPKKQECSSVFGAIDGVGLFPFTEHAISRFFGALKVDDRGQTWRTPRGILQAVLNPVLEQVDRISEDTFPDASIERTAFEEHRKAASAPTGRLSDIISAQVSEEDQFRFRLLVTYWGEPDRSDTVMAGTVPVFAGLSKPLVEAFALPWIGGAPTSSQPLNLTPQPLLAATTTTVRRLDPTEPPSLPRQNPEPSPAASPARTIAGRPQVAPPRHRTRTLTQREAMRQDLQAWSNGSPLTRGTDWNEEVHAILMRLDATRIGVSESLLGRIITKEMVKLESTTAGSRDYLMIERAKWVHDGLAARMALQNDPALSVSDATFYLRCISTMTRRLEELARDYVSRRWPIQEGGTPWSPVAALAQVLLARAWLRGVANPGDPIGKQLSSILSDEPESAFGTAGRSTPWQEWLTKTNPWHARMREELRDLVALTTDTGVRGMINSGELVAAILRMNQSGQADPVPEYSGRWPNSTAAIEAAHTLASVWNERKTQIDGVEFRLLRDRTNGIVEKLRGRSIDSHVDRVDAAVTKASELLGNRGIDQVHAWKKALSELRSKPSVASVIEDLIVAMEADEAVPSTASLRFCWLSSLPAGALDEIGALLSFGEKAIETMRDHAKDIVSGSGGGRSISAIKTVGQSLLKASQRDSAKVQTNA